MNKAEEKVKEGKEMRKRGQEFTKRGQSNSLESASHKLKLLKFQRDVITCCVFPFCWAFFGNKEC